MRSTKGILLTVSLALAIGALTPMGAQAAPSRSALGCATQSLSVKLVGSEVMVTSHIENQCGRTGLFIVWYKLSGPTSASMIIRLHLPSHPFDLVTYFPAPSVGHYELRQRVIGERRELGQSFANFDIP
jgi:hypothetical protein